MDADRWRRVEELYHAALALKPDSQTAFLIETCDGDEELRREVESLLSQDVSEKVWLDGPAWEGAASVLDSASESHRTAADHPESSQGNSFAPDEDDPPHSSRHPFRWIVRFTAPVVILVFGYAAWLLLTRGAPTQSLGWQQESKDGFWYVARVDPAGPAARRLQSGDRLISIDGDPNVSRAERRPYRRVFRDGDTYRIAVLRDGRVHETTVSPTAGDRRLSITWFAVSLIWCGVALFIGYSRPDLLPARLAFVAGTATGLVFLQVGIIQANLTLWQPLHLVLGYHFFYRFPVGVRDGRSWSALLWLLYLGGGVAAAVHQPMNVLYWIHGGNLPAGIPALSAGYLDAAWVLTLLVFGAAAVGTVAVIGRNYRLLTDTD
jgi:hypothetical protein